MKLRNVEFVSSATAPKHYPPADRPELAFAGRSNVGKSSLLNALLNRKKLARTSKTPGRTRLINFFNVNDAMYLVDLPGYGYAKVSKSERKAWGVMLERYVRERENLVAVVVLLDIRRTPTGEDKQLFEALEHFGLECVVVLTKSDKLSKSQRFTRRSKVAKELGMKASRLVVFSSVTGEGRESLWRLLEERVVSATPKEDASSEEEESDVAEDASEGEV